MIDDLLTLLRSGGARRVGDVARELGTTPAMVEAMLEALSRMGYLQRLNQTCGDQCGACPLAGTCKAEASGNVWTLTEKGLAGGSNAASQVSEDQG
jgi:hypothetical protein